MKETTIKLRAATPLPSRGGAGVGSVYIWLSESYYAADRKILTPPLPLPYMGGEWLRTVTKWLRTF